MMEKGGGRLLLYFGMILSAGIIISSFVLASAIGTWKSHSRFVSVKGFAEKVVEADMVIWPVNFKITDNSLTVLYDKVNTQSELIRKFLADGGLDENDISFDQPKITDLETNQYRETQVKFRYIAEACVRVRTTKTAAVSELISKSGDLLKQGVALAESYDKHTEYLYTALNDIKPEMIKKATENARKAALQFALDSGSKVGKIRNATQGYFQIENLDSGSPRQKKIRVVISVEYFLND